VKLDGKFFKELVSWRIITMNIVFVIRNESDNTVKNYYHVYAALFYKMDM